MNSSEKRTIPEENLRKMLIVEDLFQVSGWGLVAIPGPTLDFFGGKLYNNICRVLILRPDGSELEADIHCSKFVGRPTNPEIRNPMWDQFVCALQGIAKEDVPIGSTIFQIVEPD